MTRVFGCSRRSRRRRLGALALLAGLVSITVMLAPGGGASSRAAVSGAPGEAVPQTDNSVPAPNVTMVGSSPQEAPNETWGVGRGNGSALYHSTLVRYTKVSGWTLGPEFQDASGAPLTAFRLAAPGGGTASPLAGRFTPTGSGVLVGEEPPIEGATEPRQVVLTRDPGGAFRETQPFPATGELALKPGETLFAPGRAPLLTALDEGSARAGALIVPVTASAPEASVLHWNGTGWTREPIELPPATSGDFRVLAIAASSPSNAWLLGQLSSGSGYPPGAVALFHRKPASGEGAVWVPAGGEAEAQPLSVKGATFTVAHTGEPPSVQAQLLTVTEAGLWIDGERADTHASTTLFFKPEGEGGKVAGSWCASGCDYELPLALPAGPSRSFAWASAGTSFGERVITGLAEGASLRLQGTTFTRVLGLGSTPTSTPGGAYGAAFSSVREGWLGAQQLPVHLTTEPLASRLTNWPVSFRHALLAVAPQPGVPVGAISSQALAVGDQGEVARYIPGDGWTPESLLSAGGRRETPRLRAVAWPTPMRAYAVGDSGSGPQMWLWRGETGLWEADPAIPYNFRGNLMGIAFDPNNPARGYAVGESGVLLSYGKSWSQEQALPAEVAGATFTSIAFAGSQAIVTYRKLLDRSRVGSYVGGLLVNEGAGWHVDQGAAAAMGSEVPLVVAGLTDGGAAFAAQSPTSGEGARIFERQAAGGAWQPVATPFPGGGAPGSLSLFREGGALRVVAAGQAAAGFAVESVPPSPPGFPPPLIEPYGVGSNTKSGVLRQTATGWSDEEHELNDATEPPGQYSRYDTVYQPDPVAAVLVDPSGAQGWAVGGFVDNVNATGVLDTADIQRYPADGVVPTGIGSAPVALDPGKATFAIGGGAQCAAPCAQRAQAGVGPDVWLGSALARAAQIGVRAFIYTGPRVTSGETVGPPTLALPYSDELERYAALLRQAPATLPTFAAASPTDLDGQQGEGAAFQSVFGALPQSPFGGSGAIQPITQTGDCADAAGCQGAYYSFDSSGPAGTVRVVVLDDSSDIQPAQLAWLEAELRSAKGAQTPAIVIGNADLNGQVAAGDAAAAGVARALVNPAASASAYFFEAPEHNITEKLPGSSIPAYGSGTLGYVNHQAEESGAFTGASGFLLGEVEFAQYSASTNVAPVTASLIPNVGELALEAQSGTLLRRSQTALFAGLARRPRAGNVSRPGEVRPETDPYIPIPAECVGTACANGLFPKYAFTSSRPDIGNFVEQNLALSRSAVLLGANGEPIPDQESGLFCAYNAGTTIVTISAGGLSASLPVTVQAGSVRRPCGTQPLKELPASASGGAPVPSPAPSPTPAGTAPSSSPPPPVVPVPPAPAVTPAHAPAPPPPPAPAFVLAAAPTAALPAILPPPLPTPARPTPPSGTSAVTSPVEAPEKEEKEEEATESVGNNAAAYRPSEHETPPVYLLSILVLAAFAGASVRRRSRPGRREVRVAPATINSSRWQRRVSRDE